MGAAVRVLAGAVVESAVRASRARRRQQSVAVVVVQHPMRLVLATPPISAGPSPAPAVVPSPDPPSAVRRTVRDGTVFLRTEMELGTLRLALVGAPSRDDTRLWLVMRVPGAPGASRLCASGTLVDGVPILFTREGYAHADGTEELRTIVTVAELQAIARATRASFRLCEFEWPLDAAGRIRIEELLARFADELAWSGTIALTP